MKFRLIKVVLVFCIILLFICSNVYAIDFFLSSDSSSDTSDDISTSDAVEPITNDEDKSSYDYSNYDGPEIATIGASYQESSDNSSLVSSSPTITTTVKSDTTLSISDIINIILISVCVVLIFLAIAILIRCK